MEGIPHPERRILTAIIGASLIACQLLRAFRDNPNWASDLRNTLARRITAFLCCQRESSSSVDRHVVQEMETRRLELARAALRGISWLCTGWVCVMVLNAALDRPRWMTYLQDAAMLLIYGATLILTSCPRLLPASRLEYWYMYFMFLSFSLAMPFVEGTQTQAIIPVLFVAQVSFGLMSSKLALVYSFNILMVLVVLAANSVSSAAETACVLENWNMTTNYLAGNTAVAVLSLHGVTMWIEADARRRIDSSNVDSAAKSLLRNLCDVVIELDSELRIVNGAAKLAAVLLRSSHTTLSGMYFHSVMSSEDSERFLRQVQAPSLQDDNPCRIMHVSMRDSWGNPMRMELFSVEFNTLDAGPQHWVGVREFTDSWPTSPGAVAEDAFPEVVRQDGPHDSVLVPREHALNHPEEVPSARQLGRRRKGQGSGTPAESTWELVGGDAASQVSASSGLSSLEACSLIHEIYLPTTGLGRTTVLLKALASCNVPYRSLTCCSFHGTVDSAPQILRELRKLPCFQMTPLGEWQCQHCGVLDPDGLTPEKCNICGGSNMVMHGPDIRVSL